MPEAQRSARFQCVLVYMRHALDPTPLVCQASWEGFILFEPRGRQRLRLRPAVLCSRAPLQFCATSARNKKSHQSPGQGQRTAVRSPAPALMQLPPLGLYIHLPWCERKCPYCDFNSHETSGIPEERYIRALLQDLRHDLPLLQERTVDTLFIGGGTPSLFSAGAIRDTIAGNRSTGPSLPDTGSNHGGQSRQRGRRQVLRFQGRRHQSLVARHPEFRRHPAAGTGTNTHQRPGPCGDRICAPRGL